MADNAGNLATGGALSDIALPKGMLSPGSATTAATMEGNLPKEAAPGEQLVRDIEIFAADGTSSMLSLSFTRTGNGWTVANSDGTGATAALAQQPDGSLTGPATTAFKGVNVDLSGLTGYAELRTVSIANQNGRAAGTLESFTLGSDGSLTGAFSNGTQQVVAQIALGNVTNPAGLQKNGGSSYSVTANSGAIEFGTPGSAGFGSISGGMLEMSNVDLSQEFTNLIVAQRGFQANARIITTGDEILQELTNLKR
jgi:flagellar hook protein FlgE